MQKEFNTVLIILLNYVSVWFKTHTHCFSVDKNVNLQHFTGLSPQVPESATL